MARDASSVAAPRADVADGAGAAREGLFGDPEAEAASPAPREFDPRAALLYKGDLSYSLAFYKTTPRASRFVVSALMILGHVLFIYGQTAPMWRLYYTIDVDAALHANSLDSRALFTELGLENPVNLTMHATHDVETFTYGYAVQQLWRAHNLGSKLGPRLAALVLVLFSGFWPHLKLVLLHVYWFVPHSELVRTTALYWLSTFGKWSLADVFVVCVMIGVLNIDLDLDPGLVLAGIREEIPEAVSIAKEAINVTAFQTLMCEKLLHITSCGHWYDLKCAACHRTASALYTNPGTAEALAQHAIGGIDSRGGGHVALRIAGLPGIYIFCFAVIISLLLSFFIDALDHRAKARNAKARRGEPPAGALGVTGSPAYLFGTEGEISAAASSNGGAGPGAGAGPAAGTNGNGPASFGTSQDLLPPALKAGPGPVLLMRRVSRRVWTFRQYVWLTFGAAVALAIVAAGVFENTMEREVRGSLPAIANKILGVEWYRTYSLWTLTEVTGASGGADFLLMGTFGFFCVFGPILRAFVCLIDLCVPGSKEQHTRLMTVISFLGSFCAWEVFLVALFLVEAEMPPITGTIINSQDTDWCDILHDAGFDPECFEVEYNILSTFALVVVGGSLLMLCTSLVIKLTFKGLDPYMDGDLGGPYCCECCPPLLIDFHRDVRLDHGFEDRDTERAPLLLRAHPPARDAVAVLQDDEDDTETF